MLETKDPKVARQFFGNYLDHPTVKLLQADEKQAEKYCAEFVRNSERLNMQKTFKHIADMNPTAGPDEGTYMFQVTDPSLRVRNPVRFRYDPKAKYFIFAVR